MGYLEKCPYLPLDELVALVPLESFSGTFGLDDAFSTVVALVFLEGTIAFSPTPGALPLPLTLSVLLFFLTLGWLPALGFAVALVMGRLGERSLTFPIQRSLSRTALRLRRFESLSAASLAKGYLQYFVKDPEDGGDLGSERFRANVIVWAFLGTFLRSK